ncbi:MAG: thioesterase family protein [Oleiphilaceae bacterium]|nr:thioesterase family protein [Oleiphilaceae bacterium]
MLSTVIQPRFSDTDALGHISNTAFPIWFEEARTGLFRIFHPTLDVKTWPLIIARIELDILAQTYWGSDVRIDTYLSKVGNASCHIIQEAWQNDVLVAKGKAVMIYFDYQQNKSVPIPEAIRDQLAMHVKDSDN